METSFPPELIQMYKEIDFLNHPWDSISIYTLSNSSLDKEFEAGKRKREVPFFLQSFQELIDHEENDNKETILRKLSAFLVQELEALKAGQEITATRCRRLTTVLRCFQSFAADHEIRQEFLSELGIVEQLILYKASVDESDNVYVDEGKDLFDCVRAVALSVFGILCQDREPAVILWLCDKDFFKVCRTCLHVGSERTKVVALHILEALLEDDAGLLFLCGWKRNKRLVKIMKVMGTAVAKMEFGEGFSARLLYHILRCYIFLCKNTRGRNIVLVHTDPVVRMIPLAVMDEFPILKSLLQQMPTSYRRVM